MLYPKLTRFWSGYSLVGQEYEINLVPSTGEVGISVILLPSLPQSEYRVEVTRTEPRLYFTVADVRVTDIMLACFKRYEGYAFFQQGFTVVLEPGMHHHLQAILPKLFLIADLAARAEKILEAELKKPVYHRMQFACDVFAKIALDGTDPDFAIELAKKYGVPDWDDEYVAAFDGADMRALLNAAQAVKPE